MTVAPGQISPRSPRSTAAWVSGSAILILGVGRPIRRGARILGDRPMRVSVDAGAVSVHAVGDVMADVCI